MRHLAISGFVIASVLIFDQLTKWGVTELVLSPKDGISFVNWMSSPPERLGPVRVEIFPFFNFSMVWNEGISFGLFSNSEMDLQPYILSGLSLIICVALFIWLLKSEKVSLVIALSMIIGGALSNVMDRIRFGAVADFFDFHLYGWHYPAFNIADSAIVLGVAYLVIDAVFLNSSSRQENHFHET